LNLLPDWYSRTTVSWTVAATEPPHVVSLALRHIGEKYSLGVLVPKNNPDWSGPWDCAEFVSWTVYQASSILYGCDRDFGDPSTADAYTGYWERDARILGDIISIDQAAGTAGAALLRFPQVGASGHIVFSDGNHGTIEAHSAATGVIQSIVDGRHWDVGILVHGIEYSHTSAVPVSPPPTLIYRLAPSMMTGPTVLAIQQALKLAGFDPGVLDGQFGPHTLSAVVAFQISRNLLPDGEVGLQTAKALGVSL
jgi:N-acetylmuramoyl-L-alanine amidase